MSEEESELQTPADAADELARHVPLRVLPAPPPFLVPLTVEALGDRKLSRERPSEAAVAAVAPHWNAFAQLVQNGGAGYLALRSIRDALYSAASSARQRADKEEEREFAFFAVLRVMQAERNRFGEDTRVIDVADVFLEGSAAERWRWSSLNENAFVAEVEPDYDVPFEQDLLTTFGRYREVFPYETWGEAVGRALRLSTELKEQADQARREAELFRFRLAVAEQVLLEYGAFGSVPKLDLDMAAERRPAPLDLSQYSIDRLLLIVLAHEEISGASPKDSRSAILGGPGKEAGGVDARAIAEIDENPGLNINWYPDHARGKAKYLAEREPINAFRSSGEGADGTDRGFFDGRFRELYDEIASAGVRSVRDVVAEATRRAQGL